MNACPVGPEPWHVATERVAFSAPATGTEVGGLVLGYADVVTRTAEELADVPNRAWPEILSAVNRRSDARALPLPRERGLRVLEALQVTARSQLGALALNTGGLIVDHGWFRILGGGGEGMPDLASANALPATGAPPYLNIAFDVLGGRFAVYGGGLGFTPGAVCYFGPDTLRWEELGIGH